MIWWCYKFLATGFGLGYLPLMPGTYGTVLGVLLLWLLRPLSNFHYVIVVGVLSLASVWIAGRAETLFAERDSPKIVIDEVVGLLVTFILVPVVWPTVVLGFVLFRFFDIVKPPPIRQSQRLPGGWGVVVDDLLAGVFANIVLQILVTVWYVTMAP